MLREIKRFLAGVLILIVAALTVGADSFRTPKGLAGLAWQSTVALYGSKTYPTGPVSHFLCTAELYRKVSGGYGVITAGHCVQTNPPDLQYSVATSIGAPLQPVQLVKAHLGDGMDFAVFLWNTDAKYPTMDFGTDDGLRVGEPVIVVNFAIGLAKQLSRGHITSTTFNKSEVCGPHCEGGFEIHLDGGGAGASGSAVVSVRTHKIIGLVVGEWEEPVGYGVMPISHFAQLAGAPDQAPVDEDAQ